MDTSTMKPREVEAYLRESIRRIFGDSVENGSVITSSHGYYTVELFPYEMHFAFEHFRKKDASRIVKSIRALKV
jgi:hypothetical protein